jgi:hypothetical protein
MKLGVSWQSFYLVSRKLPVAGNAEIFGRNSHSTNSEWATLNFGKTVKVNITLMEHILNVNTWLGHCYIYSNILIHFKICEQVTLNIDKRQNEFNGSGCSSLETIGSGTWPLTPQTWALACGPKPLFVFPIFQRQKHHLIPRRKRSLQFDLIYFKIQFYTRNYNNTIGSLPFQPTVVTHKAYSLQVC